MLNFPTSTKHELKCSVTHGVMGHLDPSQPPVKRKPFAAILNHCFVAKVELILPEELYEIIKGDLFTEHTSPVYSRVILPLSAILEGDFFTEYIKKGNVLMLSEGKIGVDNVYSLREGILTLYLDKESYERAGLVGQPNGVKGKRGARHRWVVEINLRLPSMLPGKKGFGRIMYAFKNVLTTPVTWLFCDLAATSPAPNPMDPHFPTKLTCSPEVLEHVTANVPPLKPPTEVSTDYGGDFEDFAVETHEWLSLISIESPRIHHDDQIDPFLSRYTSPAPSTVSNIVKITWQGFLSPTWAHKTFVQALLAIPRNGWFAYCVGGLGEGWAGNCKDCTILKVPDAPNEFVLWEVA